MRSCTVFTNTYINDEIIRYLTNSESKAVSKNAKKIATVGIIGIKRVFFNLYNAISRTPAKTFDTIEAAKDYLVS